MNKHHIYDSDEWNNDDSNFYDSIRLEDLPYYLKDFGKSFNKHGIRYTSRNHYKHIFHYALVKYYGISEIFINDISKRRYFSYNNILIDGETDIQGNTNFMIDLFNKCTRTICIFIDIRSIRNDNKFHTTLLIYRKEINTIEYFDSNGTSGYGYTYKLKNIMDNVLDAIPGIKFIKSKDLNGLSSYDNFEATMRSLNGISTISRSKNISGWCQIWALLLCELIYKYPNETTSNILSVLYKAFKNEECDDKLESYMLNNLLKGFFSVSIMRLKFILSKVEGKNLHIDPDVLTDYNPHVVINDDDIESEIEETMLPLTILNLMDYN